MPKLNKTIETEVDFHFPKAGLDVADAFGRQPVRKIRGVWCRSCADANNVRGYDAIAERERGGSRPGLAKLAGLLPSSRFIIQELRTLVTTNTVVTPNQTSNLGRVVFLLGVSQGVVKYRLPEDSAWTATTNNSATTPPLNASGVVLSASNNQKQYFVDGTNYRYYDPTTNSVETWAATSGTLPADASNNTARLICTWRGRTVLSGLLKDPQNWFMSKVSDPNDWNYLPAAPVPATSAVAGNNAGLGLIGDVVTALIPWSDDVLVFGGDSSIHKMTGDPYAGGKIDRVSDATGILFGEAWAKDSTGRIYFMSNRGAVYAMEPPNFQPQLISQPIDPRLRDINTGTHWVRMLWDDREQGLYVFVTALAAAASTTHYFLDTKSGAWWPMSFGNNDHNPIAACVFDGNRAADRRLIIGSWDGYAREISHDATDDDGTSISSYVFIGPILTAESDEMLLKELQAVLGETSGDVTYSVHVGDTPEAALAAAAAVSGTWVAGRNFTSPVRRADHAIYIKITSTNQWALEWIRAKFAPRGKVRRRG